MSDTYLRSSSGLTVVNSAGKAFITTSYSSGIMSGDIKGAFLSDTDTTNATATSSVSNVVQNGDFGTGDFTNWTTAGDTTPTISAGGALLTSGLSVDGTIHQVISNAPYGALIEWTITSNSAGNFGLLINGTSASSTGSEVTTFTASGSYDYTGTLTGVAFRHRVSGNGVIDDIVVRPYTEADRSVNAKGLRTYGTITKSAVATGADLVGYSGWSTSNYLEQPPNTDMNVGTGDYYVMGWAYPTNNTTGYVWEYGQTLNTSGYTEMFYHDSGQFRFFLNGQGAVYGNVTSNTWNHFVAMRSGGVMYLYINGKLANQATNTASLSNTSAKLRIGIRAYDITAPFYGKIALFRMGASAPSPEQIKKIYEDEKVLFQENAACTLYGSSDAVTALAYDDSNDLLHVGTSSGRSDFQGLRRINNTTTAVTTAMSASNGLVAEQ